MFNPAGIRSHVLKDFIQSAVTVWTRGMLRKVTGKRHGELFQADGGRTRFGEIDQALRQGEFVRRHVLTEEDDGTPVRV